TTSTPVTPTKGKSFCPDRKISGQRPQTGNVLLKILEHERHIADCAFPHAWSDNPSIGAPDRHQRGYRVLDRDRQRFKRSTASSGTAGVAAVVFLDPRISRYSKNSSIVINAVDFIVISMCFPP